MANQEANIAYEKELAKWRDMLPKPLKQGQFRIKSIESGSQHINIMISDNVGEYAKLIGESSAFLLAPDSSCVFAWGVWDKGFTAMYLSVTPSHTHYTVTFGKQDDAAKLVTQLKALVGKGEPVFVQVHKARINPLNQKIVGTEDNSYAGDARVVRVDRDSMQLAVAYDAGIAPGLVASGAYTKQGSQEKVEIPQEEVWGTLEADDRPVTPAREKPPAATEPAPVQADLAPKPAAATEAAQVPLVGGNWSLTTTWANGGTTRGVAKFTVNGNQVQIVATTSFNVLGHDKLQHKAFEQDTFIGTLTGTNLVAQCNSPIATQDGKDVPARGLPFVLKMVVGNDGKSAQGTVSNAAGAVRQVTMSAQ
jgi:hypothetical protein